MKMEFIANIGTQVIVAAQNFPTFDVKLLQKNRSWFPKDYSRSLFCLTSTAENLQTSLSLPNKMILQHVKNIWPHFWYTSWIVQEAILLLNWNFEQHAQILKGFEDQTWKTQI